MKLSNFTTLFVLGALVMLIAIGAFAQTGVPQNVTITKMGNAGYRLNWNPVAGATSYYIYRDNAPITNVGGMIPIDEVTTNSYFDNYTAPAFYAVVSVFPAGTLSGTVFMPNGTTPLDCVLVYINDSKFTYTLAGTGSYTITNIPVGTYTVKFYRVLYAVGTVANVTISAGQVTTLNYTMNQPPFTVVSGTLPTGTTNWVNTNIYQLSGMVQVPNGGILNIQEGTTIVGSYPSLAFLVVSQGGRIYSVGTKYMPVVWTSNRSVSTRNAGDWGGIIINGYAQNNRGIVPNGEGNSGQYGSTDTLSNNDNSGIIRYNRIEFAGYRFTPTNELNGLALQSVGRGTEIRYVQITQGLDDAIEFFGGSVDCDHIVATDGGDDGFDWTEGWNGKAHHVLIRQRAADSDCGIEADNLEQNHSATPYAHPNLSNFTIIGKKDLANHRTGTNPGMNLRRGTGFNLFNFIVTRSRGGGIDIDDSVTCWRASSAIGVLNGSSRIDYSIFWDNAQGAAAEGIDPTTGPGIGDGHFWVETNEWPPSNRFRINSLHLAAPVGWTQNLPSSNFAGSGFIGSNATNAVVDPLIPTSATTGNPEVNAFFDARPPANSPAVNGAVTPAPAGVLAQYGLPYANYIGAFNGPNDDWHVGWTGYISAVPPPPFYTITGFVRNAANQGIPGVTIASDITDPATTGPDGSYTIYVTHGTTVTLTPQPVPGYSSFTPPSRTHTNVTGNLSNQNFVANP
ncbi:MAG: carboxypeptidase-like regulatory domain-containing protein [bacterium]|nr:carboxypeptidase-like regulatory domain-containing protein [bacterium]